MGRWILPGAFILATLTLPTGAADRAYVVKSPDASFFDVEQRRRYLQATQDPALRQYADALQPKECRPEKFAKPIRGAVRMPPYYVNNEKNPEWLVAARPFFVFSQTVTEWSSRFAVTGNREYARCLLLFLDSWAAADALLDSGYTLPSNRQAWHQTEWALADAALAYSIVRPTPGLDAERRARVEKWLRRASRNHIAHPGSPNSDCCNNHLYWRAVHAAATGLVTDDDELFNWGLRQYSRALADMNPDGSLPLEMGRGKRALHYQSFAIYPLVLLAELGARQGYDLYSQRVKGRSLHDAVRFLVAALQDPSKVRPYTSAKQDLAFAKGLSWAEPYHRRFATPELIPYLGKSLGNVGFGGPLTLYFHVGD